MEGTSASTKATELRAAVGAVSVSSSVPLVSVILACRCEVKHIQEALTSILAQEPPEGGFEVIVADGMSDDGTREVLQKVASTDPRVRIIDNCNKYTSSGLNAAIRAAAGRIVVRMDAHTVYAPDYIRQCVAVLRSTGADNVGGPWIAHAGNYIGAAVAAAFQCRFATGGARSHLPHYEGPVDTVYLGCWNKEVFQRFGGFDEALARNQDDEHNLRITRGGGRVWQSARIRSWYHCRTSLRGLFRQYQQYGYWKVEVVRKHGRPASLRHFVPAAFVLALILASLVCGFGCILASLWPSPARARAFHDWLVTPAWVLLATLAFCYTSALAVASILTARRTQWKALPVMPLVFCCYHFGYGIGFIRGFVERIIMRREASGDMVGLTREAAVQITEAQDLRRSFSEH